MEWGVMEMEVEERMMQKMDGELTAKVFVLCICVMCCVVVNGMEVYECNAWFYRERMDGRTCEWQLGMIKEGSACVMTTRLVGGNLKMQMGMLEMQGWARHGCVCVLWLICLLVKACE
ncbi:S2-RNase [Pyrus ussuriensis x Pyrus communis]|uniref:S2-RNase n=1 Tax=Pyrus ussuriensis x Pyrus communis TaxID=2448454 RepID=A0A5N5FBS9_9ROSA|nr:S2-RNase [Pyrus ussuriensis x Pyrus communis]